MKKRTLTVMLILAITLLCSVLFSPFSAASAEKTEKIPEESPALAARFMNMLNHNASYNSDFDSVDMLVNNAACMLSAKLGLEDEFISERTVADYMMDMYGIEVTDTSALNPEFPKKDGYIFVIPRGLTVYSHSFISAVKNEDGSYTVKSLVKIKPHDGGTETVEAVSLFVPSKTSPFGFNLISSEIPEPQNAV